MKQEDKRQWALAWLIGLLIYMIPLMGLILSSDPDGTTSCVNLVPGTSCFHYFESTDTTTTADSGLYEVDKCSVISYRIDDASGAASIYPMECSEQSTTGDCGVFACDYDGDGVIDNIDKATVMVADSDTDHCTRHPTGRWHWIDVQSVPSSGDGRITIVCH